MREGDWRVEARFERGRLEGGSPLWERETRGWKPALRGGDWRVEARFERGRLEGGSPL